MLTPGSIVYLYYTSETLFATEPIKVSQFLKDTSLLEDAKKAANLITPELIADDKSLDIISGNSGAILGLLTLYHQTKDLTALDKAVLCGQHLLANRLSLSGSPRG